MSVTRDGEAVSLEPKAMDVLLYLLAHRDRLVTKDELLDAVWKDTFVTPNALTRAVAQVRKALGDDAHEARVIETVSKRGYRFIAPVIETPAPEVEVQASPSAPPHRVTAAVSPSGTNRLGLAFAALVGLVVVASVSAAVWFARRPQSTAPASDVAITRFTTRQGYDGLPAISPDGRTVVYVSDRTGSLELYQTGLTLGAPDVVLTNNGGRNTLPEWSPDGQWIAFRSQRFGGIWIVAAAGGAPQQIIDSGSDPSWSADSEHLVFVSEGVSTAAPSSLWTVRRDGTDRKAIDLGTTMVGSLGQPSWSHHGRFIAFSLNHGSALRDIWLTSIDGRVVRKLATGLTGQDIRWTPDDDGLFWGGTTDQHLSRIMYLAIHPETGEPIGTPEARVPIDGGRVEGLSLTRDGRALFGIARGDSNLWQIDLHGNVVGEPSRLTNDAVRTTYPRIAQDGRIAFIQFVEGRQTTAWIMASDGSGRTPLLSSGAMQVPQWSRDNRRMFVLLDGNAVWVDIETRRTIPIPVQFELPGGVQLAPDDAGLLNHRGSADGIINVWLSPFDGGPPRQMTFDPEGASYGAFSPDGRWMGMQLTRGADTWLGVMAAQPGAQMVPLVKERGQSWLYSWSPGSDRMAFAGERDGVWNIFDVERASGTVRQLTHWTGREGFVRYPAWAPSGDRIVFERSTRMSSIWTTKLW
jgi:Tol biopolymer transport system component/DNA-binding winged helix-turn-helix (wHTH) protein